MREAAQFVKDRGTKDLIVAEIGVERGKNAYDMLYEMDIKRLYLVDPYIDYTDGRGGHVPQNVQDNVYREMFKRLENYFDKIVLVNQTSEFASTLFPDEFFDFVYIDANHDYEYIKQDIALWWPKVKINGILGGHDFDRDQRLLELRFAFSVYRAVLEFVKEDNFKLMSSQDPSLLMGADWWIVK